ncbi:cytosol aminopeptidase-like isoform X2 [Amyelois transitella]|uniref:cytosol aminopeptidase-like isoform X2 n=1 Tax=Amyelois transitella TaxID=680683 RepID=UPI00298FB3A0|nr:cytosol aminopeptidase-like isoform X2 [Amyelois transitella]
MGPNLCVARAYSQVAECSATSEDKDEPPLDGNKKGLVLGVYEADGQFELTEAAAEVDQKSDGKISQHLTELSCQLQLGKSFAVTDVPGYSAVALASYGPKNACYNKLEELDEARENVRWGVGAGVRVLQSRGCALLDVDPGTRPDAAAEAAQLAAWRFQEFRACKKPKCQVTQYGGAGAEWGEGAVRGDAQNWARHLSDMPANKMTPIDLAQAALDELCPLGVVVEARDREWISSQDMRAFLAVARGSCEEPAFLECAYRGGRERQPPVLLVAKGVTFDSGGLCLKSSELMCENRGSMAGAAVVLATLKIIATLKVPINVVALLPLCENMISGQCMKVGDVVRALNGVNIQIEDTDMEGRLMMADALVYGQTIYRPSLVIDVATFTRGVLLATGGGAYGCFSNSEAAWRLLRRAGARAGDRPWRFPLWNYYHQQIVDDPAVDLRNKGSGSATPCLGAAFLRRFVCCDWLHVDVTGVGKVAHAAPPYLRARRMSGRPARALAAALADVAAPRADDKQQGECG